MYQFPLLLLEEETFAFAAPMKNFTHETKPTTNNVSNKLYHVIFMFGDYCNYTHYKVLSDTQYLWHNKGNYSSTM